MGITDISAEYRRYLIKLINDGEYDHAPNFKRLALDHLDKWNKWATTCSEVLSYGPFKTIFLFPRFLYLEAQRGRLYSELTASQEKLTRWVIDYPDEAQAVEDTMALKVLTREGPVQ